MRSRGRSGGRAPRRRLELDARAALLAVALGLGPAACAAPQAPEALVELRRTIGGEPLEAGRQAAPDLVAEAERSLAVAERALAAGDQATASRMATLGCIQARTAFAMARQRAAQERLRAAERATAVAAEDLTRYLSDAEDATREIERLEALGRQAPSEAPPE